MVALTCSLGRWQLHRADYKRGLQRDFDSAAAQPAVHLGGPSIDPAALRYRHVSASGRFDPRGTVFLDNKFSNERVGYRVVTPLRLEDSNRPLLVDRGFVPRGPRYPEPPAIETPTGPVDIAGIATVPTGRFVELSRHTESGSVWQNLTFERYREKTGIDVQPILLVQLEGPPDGLTRSWERPDLGIERHQGYAFQWFSLAALTVVVWIVANLKRAHAH
jgi:surfeit locus 1 family protein